MCEFVDAVLPTRSSLRFGTTRLECLPCLIVRAAAAFLFAATAASAVSEVGSAPGVVYKTVDQVTDAKARQSVADAFSGGLVRVRSIFSSMVVCGPGYWRNIKDDWTIRSETITPVTFRVPNTTTGETQTLNGVIFRDPSSKRALAARLATDVGRKPLIRKLTPEEIRICWAIMPFDIEEPIYILESNKRRFLVSLKNEDQRLSVMWVDELSEYNLRLDRK